MRNLQCAAVQLEVALVRNLTLAVVPQERNWTLQVLWRRAYNYLPFEELVLQLV